MKLCSGGSLAENANAIAACEIVPTLDILCNTSRVITETGYHLHRGMAQWRESERDGVKKWVEMLLAYWAQ